MLGEPEWDGAAREAGAGGVDVVAGSNGALARRRGRAFLGRAVDPDAARACTCPGRLERGGEAPLEIWDGAHNLAGVGYLLARVPRADWVVVASILADKDVDGMLAALSAARRHARRNGVVEPARAPRGASSRRSPRPYFARVEVVAGAGAPPLARGRELAGADGAVLVTGSLYLLADLASVRPSCLPWQASASG